MPLKDPKNKKKIEDFLIEHAPLIGRTIGSLKKKGHIPADTDMSKVNYAGFYGLMDAIKKYDPEAGSKLQSGQDENPFVKYAQFRISGKILDHVHGLSKIPKNLKTRAKNLELLDRQQRSSEATTPDETAAPPTTDETVAPPTIPTPDEPKS